MSSVVFNADPGNFAAAPAPVVYDIKNDVVSALSEYYKSHIEGSLQIFHSLTLGEIVIAILLAAILMVITMKWIWESVRYG
ncbi:hypothetical protein [Paenibacillus sp. FSL R7-0128]|uniref:hypothetical protein n=1 Tax=Paenibacillus sp. FSL R7-0128 TaxID=2954529 RepID=UPI0030F6498B